MMAWYRIFPTIILLLRTLIGRRWAIPREPSVRACSGKFIIPGNIVNDFRIGVWTIASTMNLLALKAKLDPQHTTGQGIAPGKTLVESASAIFDTLRRGIPMIYVKGIRKVFPLTAPGLYANRALAR
jgi:hypothetical protein